MTSAHSSKSEFPDLPQPQLRTLSSVQQSKEGRQNLANMAIAELSEFHARPQIQLQELFQIFADNNNYTDFRKKDWSQFFSLMAKKVDTMNEMMNKAENDRDRFMVDCQAAEARFLENAQDTDEEVH